MNNNKLFRISPSIPIRAICKNNVEKIRNLNAIPENFYLLQKKAVMRNRAVKYMEKEKTKVKWQT
jgi:hypothetical protein